MSYSPDKNYVHVVIGIIQNSKQQVLVSERKAEAHLGGLQEFPGGKVEKNETPKQALRRELKEELAIDMLSASPLIKIPYHYPERNILLDVFMIKEYSGEISANEDQAITWRSIDSLNQKCFPEANFGVLRALKFPRIYPVTPDFSQEDNFIERFKNVLYMSDIRIIQFRSHSLSDQEYKNLAKKCADICNEQDVKLILNRNDEIVSELTVAGLHLTSKKLQDMKHRPLSSKYIIGASCHNLQEVKYANKLKLDYIFIGPVVEKHQFKASKSLGWEGFSELAMQSQAPVYAIGGMTPSDIETSTQNEGQGIAAIRAIWTSAK